MLGDAAEDAADLTDRAVHELERAEGRAVLGSERVGGDVVVEVVHVDDGNAVVQIARDLRREELAHPHRDADLDLRPLPASARAAADAPRQRTRNSSEHDHGLADALQRDPAEHDEPGQHADETRAARPRQLGEAEEVVLGAAGEHASVDAAAAKDADAARDVRRLDAGRMPGAREVDVRAAALVVVVEARDIGLHPVHRGHLKRGRGGRHADAHRVKAVPTARRASSRRRACVLPRARDRTPCERARRSARRPSAAGLAPGGGRDGVGGSGDRRCPARAETDGPEIGSLFGAPSHGSRNRLAHRDAPDRIERKRSRPCIQEIRAERPPI